MNERFHLFVIWFVGFVVCFLMVLSFWYMGWTVSECVRSNLIAVTAVFAPFLTPIVAFWYVANVREQRPEYSKPAYRAAMVTSAFYILVMVTLVASVYWREGAGVIEDTLSLAGEIATLLAFLVGPAIGYFFGRTKSAS